MMSSKLHRKLETAALSLHFDAGGQEESLRICRLKRPAGWCSAAGPEGSLAGRREGDLAGARARRKRWAGDLCWAAGRRARRRGASRWRRGRRSCGGASGARRGGMRRRRRDLQASGRRRARRDLQARGRGARAGAGRGLASGSAAPFSGSLLARSFRRRFP
jgi:hypothetical protein